MAINCLECKHKCGLPFNLAFHYSIYHEDKISKCADGDETLSGICVKIDCSFKDESGYNSSSSINSNSNSSINSITNYNSNSDSSTNSNSNSNCSNNSNANSSISANYNSNSNSNFNTKVLTRSCNKCNFVKPLTDFDERISILVEIVFQLKLIVYIVLLL